MKNRVKEYAWHIEWREPNELKPYEYNAKLHDDKQVKNIANSIKKFGWQQPAVVTNDDVLIIGHGRRLAVLINDAALRTESQHICRQAGFTEKKGVTEI